MKQVNGHYFYMEYFSEQFVRTKNIQLKSRHAKGLFTGQNALKFFKGIGHHGWLTKKNFSFKIRNVLRTLSFCGAVKIVSS